MSIIHCINKWLVNADYFLRSGHDLCFDPLYSEYLRFSSKLRRLYPPPEGPMLPENMPGYRTPRRAKASAHAGAISASTTLIPSQAPHDERLAHTLSAIFLDDSQGHVCLHNVPIQFGFLAKSSMPKKHKALLNREIPVLASNLVQTAWVVNGFNNGHFVSTLLAHKMDAEIIMAADVYPTGRSMFKQLTSCPVIEDSSQSLLNAITSATSASTVHGFFFHSR